MKNKKRQNVPWGLQKENARPAGGPACTDGRGLWKRGVLSSLSRIVIDGTHREVGSFPSTWAAEENWLACTAQGGGVTPFITPFLPDGCTASLWSGVPWRGRGNRSSSRQSQALLLPQPQPPLAPYTETRLETPRVVIILPLRPASADRRRYRSPERQRAGGL